MSHRFFVAADQLAGDRVTFSAAQAHQLGHVLRLRPGETVLVFDGVVDVDRVVRLDSASAGHIAGTRPQPPEPRTRLVAYPSLLQRDKFETVLQKLAEVGASCIVPVLTARSVVRQALDERRQTRWQAILREAAEQAGRGRLPGLAHTRPFAEAVQTAAAAGPALVAHPGDGARPLRQTMRAIGAPQQVAIFVGPEGGYTAAEVAVGQACGAHLVSLGPRTWRTETVSPVLAALVLYDLDDLSSATS